jgi:hypothetical protein
MPECRKRKYMSRETAELRLKIIQGRIAKRELKKNRERRPYKCPKCGCWHLTKKGG